MVEYDLAWVSEIFLWVKQLKVGKMQQVTNIIRGSVFQHLV